MLFTNKLVYINLKIFYFVTFKLRVFKRNVNMKKKNKLFPIIKLDAEIQFSIDCKNL